MKIIIDGKAVDFPSAGGGGGSPIGTVISFMGTSAPTGYLVCDGAEYEISAYPNLAKFFEQQFGTKNHFGGNGTDTFAVPDLRNLFLRGYHGDAEEQLSGNIGTRQEATEHTNFGGTAALWVPSHTGSYAAKHPDSLEDIKKSTMNSQLVPQPSGDTPVIGRFTSRPINAAILFCIKAINEGGSGGSGSAEIESYDTNDGWHVRKWSDGYMEQTLKKGIKGVIINTSWGSLYNNGRSYGPFQYPEAFSELYGVSISGAGTQSLMITAYYEPDETLHLTKTPGISVCRPTPLTVGTDFHFFITARGRWK